MRFVTLTQPQLRQSPVCSIAHFVSSFSTPTTSKSQACHANVTFKENKTITREDEEMLFPFKIKFAKKKKY